MFTLLFQKFTFKITFIDQNACMKFSKTENFLLGNLEFSSVLCKYKEKFPILCNVLMMKISTNNFWKG